MTKVRSKPQGTTGPVKLDSNGISWDKKRFPEAKADREEMVARLFIKGFTSYVRTQSEPSFAPFDNLRQNLENDLDFTVGTAQGEKLMELAEFAPLAQFGGQFANAPKELDPKTKADLVLNLIRDKSAHQGGDNRFLVIYATEYAFKLDPMTIERLRRKLASEPVKFDRIYATSIHDLDFASVSEIYPGEPHHDFGNLTNEALDRVRFYQPHPTDIVASEGKITLG